LGDGDLEESDPELLELSLFEFEEEPELLLLLLELLSELSPESLGGVTSLSFLL